MDLKLFIRLMTLIALSTTGMAEEQYFVFQGGTVLSDIRPLELHQNLLIYSRGRKAIDSVAVDSLLEINVFGGTQAIHGAVVGGAVGFAVSMIATQERRTKGGEALDLVPLVAVVAATAVGAALGSRIVKSGETYTFHDFSGKTTEEKRVMLQNVLFGPTTPENAPSTP